MNIQEAKNIDLAAYLHTLGIAPSRKQGNNLWYRSPFREETDPSFKINLSRNEWYDFGLGKGGNILDFVMEYHGTDSVSHALQIISSKIACSQTNQANQTSQVESFSFRPPKSLPSFEDIRVQPLNHLLLIEYLKERKIYIPFVEQACKEIHFTTNAKRYFAIGFENGLGGYELRNKYFQGCISPKGITAIRNENDTCCVFEGFMDYLSYLSLKNKHYPEQPDHIAKRDYIILNSVVNVSKALDIIGSYKEKYCFLDNDKAGTAAYLTIRDKCGLQVSDQSRHYRGYKDLNDYLCNKKQVQEKRKSRGMKL